MLISQTVEYAIRAMSAIAALPEGIKIRAIDIGRATGIPAPYLSKILRRLVLAVPTSPLLESTQSPTPRMGGRLESGRSRHRGRSRSTLSMVSRPRLNSAPGSAHA